MIIDNNEIIPKEDALRLKKLVDATRLDVQLKDVCMTLESVQESLNQFNENDKWLLDVTDTCLNIARAYNLIRSINADYATLYNKIIVNNERRGK